MAEDLDNSVGKQDANIINDNVDTTPKMHRGMPRRDFFIAMGGLATAVVTGLGLGTLYNFTMRRQEIAEYWNYLSEIVENGGVIQIGQTLFRVEPNGPEQDSIWHNVAVLALSHLLNHDNNYNLIFDAYNPLTNMIDPNKFSQGILDAYQESDFFGDTVDTFEFGYTILSTHEDGRFTYNDIQMPFVQFPEDLLYLQGKLIKNDAALTEIQWFANVKTSEGIAGLNMEIEYQSYEYMGFIPDNRSSLRLRISMEGKSMFLTFVTDFSGPT